MVSRGFVSRLTAVVCATAVFAGTARAQPTPAPQPAPPKPVPPPSPPKAPPPAPTPAPPATPASTRPSPPPTTTPAEPPSKPAAPVTTPGWTPTTGIPKAKAPVCTEGDACAALCKDGAGNLDACVKLGDLALAGRRSSPDAAKALTAYRVACGYDAQWRIDAAKPAEPRGCLAAAELLDRGWLFDVEKDPARATAVLERAIELASAKCTDTDPSRCDIAARALEERDRKLPASRANVPARLAFAERGCTHARQVESCRMVTRATWQMGQHESLKSEVKRLRGVADGGLTQACLQDGDAMACANVEYKLDGERRLNARAILDKRCQEGDKHACAAIQYELILKHRKEPAKQAAAAKAMIALCDGEGHPLCAALAEALVSEKKGKRIGIAIDAAKGVALAVSRCDLGDVDGCSVAALAYGPNGPVAARDPLKARAYADRACTLTRPDRDCGECKDDATLPSCMRRAAYAEHDRCLGGAAGACERIATRFDKGDGVERSLARAADYLRRGCDAAERSACVALDELCLANPSLPASTCQQALIHSDLFYEAEYQLGAGGDAELIDPDKPATKPDAPAPVTIGSVVAATPTSFRRAKLDADLVVDVVIDRVRQAAIELVVDQLVSAEHKARYRYLRDLLEQGASLLAEPSTLRREKFQDLGMIVVRAFVAANLVEGLYPTGAELLIAPEIGATVARGQSELAIDPSKPLPAVVHGYLVDVAYYWLGETRLFGRTNRKTKARSLDCPWAAGQGAVLCRQLAERASAERVIGIDKVLDGLRLAKALRDGGFDDLRRLIEASSRSRTIADFGTTPGLQLQQWRSRIVDATRARVESVREGLVDVRILTRASVFGDTGFDLATLAAHATGARAALDAPAVRLSIGTESASNLMRIVTMIERAARDGGDASGRITIAGGEVVEVQTVTGPVALPPPPPRRPRGKQKPGASTAGGFDPGAYLLAKLRRDVLQIHQAWGARDLVDLGKKLDSISHKLDNVPPQIDRLETAIADINGLLGRFPHPDGSPSLDVANLPLYATPDLARELRAASRSLTRLEDALRSLFPGEVHAHVRFSRSAAVRLLGFLDLMERVARSSRLTQKTGEVIGALRTLGTYRVRVFDAPLYDVLEPILDSIKTHEPMTLEMIYAVIAHVRLDTLVGKLRGDGNPCDKESSVDCWTTRLVHALQESVERDANGLTIDGGKFATRLAQHGDDFRRRHQWRGFLHLTVGVGALYSDPVGDMGDTRRSVPLISEQIGFGFASPSFAGDRLTFKVGAAASGLLYRAVVDSEESRAIMVHPLLLAVDIGDLVEVYVSPATLMLYPPEDDRDTALRWAVTAGVSVPLSAYLERL
jgi:TPR repeat protein